MNALDIDDFVYAATGARLRRLTLEDGSHWFPAVDVARQLGYASARQALRAHVDDALHTTLAELPVTRHRPTTELRHSTRMVCLEGLVQLVNASGRTEAAPFKSWVAHLVAAVQRDGSYGLEPAPGHAGFVQPQPLLDALVRREARDLQRPDSFDDHLDDHLDELRAELRDEARDGLSDELRDEACDQQETVGVAACVERVAVPAQRSGPALTAEQLLDSWCERNAVVGDDVHAVAACLAPALVRGGVRYRLDEVARRTGLSAERVRDCVRVLVERGCMRYAGRSGSDGGLLYVLP
ncbi:Bro-N domain-containing protein [Streptomyces sp. NPDC053493]|uniref:Bro-N domain-containing protein n=1 Tax=Streptomyces sp. NPDC053493 TaxID=3365705 RepID=UPI0037D579F7